jgi:Neutral/alkaline non-lysosomal ceramidase, N-terminal
MVNRLLIVLGVLMLLCLAGCSGLQPRARKSSLLLGTGVRTITPPLGVPLVGYPSPRPNTGVGLDLCARAAVFGTPGKSEPEAALVVLDLIHVDADLGRAIRERAAAALPGLSPEAIMVSGTHTHSGPAVSERYAEDTDTGRDAGYIEKVIALAAEAIVAGWTAREEVHMRIGHASARLGHNRRVVDAGGQAKNEWKDLEGFHSGIFNPDIPFVVFDDARTGTIRAILVSYGCHPVVLGPGNTKVSADYPGYAVRALESMTKARTAIFITGAAGNINPRECLFAEPERARPMGEAIAAEVVASLGQTRPLKALPIAIVSAPLNASVRPEAEKRYAARLEKFPEGRRIVSEVQVLRLGELAFVSAPGELVAELGMAVQNSSPLAQTIIVYNANDHLGYLVTEAIRREGGHEANSAVSLDLEKPFLAAAREALARAAATEK